MKNYFKTFRGWTRYERLAALVVIGLALVAVANLPLTKALMVNQQSYACEQLVKFRAGLYTDDTEILAASVAQLDSHYAEWNTCYDKVNSDSTHWDTGYTHTLSTSNPHAVTKAQVGLTSVEDSALSTWTGSTNITTLGTIATGDIPAERITSGSIDSDRMPTDWTGATSITTLGTIATGTLPWANLSKTSSSLADLSTKSAGALDTGNLDVARLPTGGEWALSSNLGVDSPTLYIDQANNRIGILTTLPACALDIAVPTGGGVGFLTNSATGDGVYFSGGNTLNFNYGRNSDQTGYINYTGYNNGTGQYRSLSIANGKNTVIATFSGATGNTEIVNFTKLGSAAPAVKMVEITGTTAGTEGAQAQAAHGVTSSKIISATALVFSDANTGWTPSCTLGEFGTSGYGYCLNFDGTNVFITNHPTESENILTKAFVVTIFYKE